MNVAPSQFIIAHLGYRAQAELDGWNFRHFIEPQIVQSIPFNVAAALHL